MRRPSDPAGRYAYDVVQGHEVAGPLVRLACARHFRDLERWGAGRASTRATGCTWRPDIVERVVAFFAEELVLPDVVDEDGVCASFVLAPYQAFKLGSMFGWMRADGHRRYRTHYWEEGKGNGKTPLGAGVGLYCMTQDGQKYPEVYSAAVSQAQANITWTDAKRMVDESPRLRDFVEITAHALVADPAIGGGKFVAVSSEYRTLQGIRPHCALIDELHEHPDHRVATPIRRGTKRNKDAVIVEMTNSGSDRASFCYQHHEYSRRILEQVIENDAWFAYVCGLDEGDEYTDERIWKKANPNLGVTIDYPYLREAVTEAQGMPVAEGDVQRLNFCVWAEKSNAYIPASAWAAAARPSPPDLQGRHCVGALDLGQTDDLCAFDLTWVLGDEQFFSRTWYWVPKDAVKKHKDRPWAEWRKAGRLVETEGDVIDYARVRADVSRLARQYGCREIAFDKRFAAQLAQELQGESITMIDQPQGFALNEPTRKLGALLKAGGYGHDGHPMDTWQASNLVVTKGTRGEIRPDKEKSAEKIDGLVAKIMALGRAVVSKPKKASRYTQPGARVEAVGPA